MRGLDGYLDGVVASGLRCWPTKLIFIETADRFQCVFDLGLGIRVKKRAALETAFTPPDAHSMNDVERGQAREAKTLVMDTFMGLEGIGLVRERSDDRCILKELLFRGVTSHEVAVVVLPRGGSLVSFGAYMEVMRAYDFDRAQADFEYGGPIGS